MTEPLRFLASRTSRSPHTVVARVRAATPSGLLALLLLVFLSSCGESGPRRRNVILITIDTLRADYLSGAGYRKATSPRIDEFLRRGTRFQHAFSTSCRTAPSHVSLMTGLYPSFTTVDVENGNFPLHQGFETLAEICQENGFRTAAIVSNPVLGKRLGLDQGFETYDDDLSDKEVNRDALERIAEKTVVAARNKVAELQEDPFFLWVHFQDPHGPYTPPARYLDRDTATSPPPESLRLDLGENHSGYGTLPKYQILENETELAEYVRRYEAEIRYLDDQIGSLFADWERSGVLEETLVVLTADHGEAFGEDGFYCAHGHGLGLDQVWVPLAFVGPDIPGETLLSSWVSNLDVYATILDFLGLDTAKSTGQSSSLLDSLRDGSEPLRTGYAESVTQRAVFTNGAYLRKDRRPLEDAEFWRRGNPFTGAPYVPLGTPRISRIATDTDLGKSPIETEALDPAENARRDLELQLDEFAQRAETSRREIRSLRGNSAPLTERDRERLRALGYLR